MTGVGRDAASPGRERERGQAMVEFALILFPLLLLVAGIIWFGIGLNYWLDMQRIANQGARWAAVNNWPPDCPPGSTSCTGTRTLQQTMLRQALTTGLRNTVSVTICYPGKSAAQVTRGDPVRVQLTSPFTLFWLERFPITLRASSTMRLEQKPTLITGADRCAGT
ncbi:MAG: TadE/TadG family type IV pilus assembly protein [Thermoleophilia bacterium]|nr:TadE/TadG family type IV pilus assembly protein [Thermoleophilia bacterium]